MILALLVKMTQWIIMCKQIRPLIRYDPPSCYRPHTCIPRRSHIFDWSSTCIISRPCSWLLSHPPTCKLWPPWATHLITIESAHTAKFTHSQSRIIWRYSHADFDLAQQLIAETNWEDIITDNIDSSWLNCQRNFLELMETCIPQKVPPPRRRRNRPWLSKGIVQATRRRNALFKRAKRSGAGPEYAKFCRARNKVVADLRKSKATYFRNSGKSILNNLGKLWNVSKGPLHPLLFSPTIIQPMNCTKKRLMFWTLSLPPAFERVDPTGQTVPADVLCEEEEVADMLRALDITKSNGQDGISTRMLKSTAAAIAPSIRKLFNLSIQLGRPPAAWKNAKGAKSPIVSRAYVFVS